jgi:excisionase family DNA binding protein
MLGVVVMPKGDKKSTARAPDWSDVPAVLSTQQAADVLGVHLNTIKQMIYRGELAAFKVGKVHKINKVDLMKYAGLTPPDEAI